MQVARIIVSLLLPTDPYENRAYGYSWASCAAPLRPASSRIAATICTPHQLSLHFSILPPGTFNHWLNTMLLHISAHKRIATKSINLLSGLNSSQLILKASRLSDECTPARCRSNIVFCGLALAPWIMVAPTERRVAQTSLHTTLMNSVGSARRVVPHWQCNGSIKSGSPRPHLLPSKQKFYADRTTR